MKLTKVDSRLHDEALAVLSLCRALTDDEKEFVFTHYDPGASHNIGKGAIFFTPVPIARVLTDWASGPGDVIDLCAGIGVLGYHLWRAERQKRMVMVEINPEFVEVGKKVFPEAEWHCLDVFDRQASAQLGTFDYAISNPPYGNIPVLAGADWLKVRAPAQFLVMELIARLTHAGGYLIIPAGNTDYDMQKSVYQHPAGLKALRKHFPGLTVTPCAQELDEWRGLWRGAQPEVVIADLNFDVSDFDYPYGFGD